MCLPLVILLGKCSSSYCFALCESRSPVPQACKTAVGLLSNLETARRDRSVLLSDEQDLLEKEEKEGYA